MAPIPLPLLSVPPLLWFERQFRLPVSVVTAGSATQLACAVLAGSEGREDSDSWVNGDDLIKQSLFK